MNDEQEERVKRIAAVTGWLCIALTVAQLAAGLIALYVWGLGGSVPDDIGLAIMSGTLLTGTVAFAAFAAAGEW